MSWIKIDDQLPPIGELVWVIEDTGRITLAERMNDEPWSWSGIDQPFFVASDDRICADTCCDDINPVLWHPLPQIPDSMKNLCDIRFNPFAITYHTPDESDREAARQHLLDPKNTQDFDLRTIYSKQVDSVGNYEQIGYMPADRGWWCTVCHKPVDGNDVAVEELFKETHDVKKGGCGGKVIIKKHEP